MIVSGWDGTLNLYLRHLIPVVLRGGLSVKSQLNICEHTEFKLLSTVPSQPISSACNNKLMSSIKASTASVSML